MKMELQGEAQISISVDEISVNGLALHRERYRQADSYQSDGQQFIRYPQADRPMAEAQRIDELLEDFNREAQKDRHPPEIRLLRVLHALTQAPGSTFTEHDVAARYVVEWALNQATAFAELRADLELAYTVMGLAGEAGELVNRAKKILRGDEGAHEAFLNTSLGELGDCQYYLARIAEFQGQSLSLIMAHNIRKLEGRAERGTICGTGEQR